MSRIAKAALLFLLLPAVLLEGYYIMVLRERVSRNADDLKNISSQLQTLKLEREKLNEDVSAAQKNAGEGQPNEHTAAGQH